MKRISITVPMSTQVILGGGGEVERGCFGTTKNWSWFGYKMRPPPRPREPENRERVAIFLILFDLKF